MDESLDACRRELGRLHMLLMAAHEEIDFIRDRVDLIAAARMHDLRQTIVDQTALIDERDAYIRRLEALVDGLREQVRATEQQRNDLIRDTSLLRTPARVARLLSKRLRDPERP